MLHKHFLSNLQHHMNVLLPKLKQSQHLLIGRLTWKVLKGYNLCWFQQGDTMSAGLFRPDRTNDVSICFQASTIFFS